MYRRALLLSSPALSLPFRPAQALSPLQGEVLAPGWRMHTLIRWGDSVLSDAPAWAPGLPEAEAAATQFGWDGRLVAAIASPRATDGLPRMVLAVVHPQLDPAMAFPDGRDRPEVAAMMQGASIINLEHRGQWVVSAGGFQARRLTGATLCRATGPGAERLGGAVQGVFGLSGGCAAAGGRLLLTEGEASDWAPRLPGRVGPGHGWVMECSAAEPGAIPAKRTALGSSAWDAASTELADGRIVVFLAHSRGLARFISAGPGSDPDALDEGSLAAARMGSAGLAWEPMAENAWMDMAAALVSARATPLPAGAALHYGASGLILTAPGEGSQLLRPQGDAAAARYGITILARAQEPAGQVAALDGPRRTWLGTEALEGAAGMVLGDGQMVLAAPRGASIGGLLPAADGSALFAMLRRPGGGAGRSFARPATRWPDFTAGTPPRSALVVLSGRI